MNAFFRWLTRTVIHRLVFLGGFVLLGCGQNHELVRWHDGTNDCYAVEVRRGKENLVLIPDVRYIQTTDRFVTGKAYWRYIEGFQRTREGNLLTNEFWFALDKHKDQPKCYVCITTNATAWLSWRTTCLPT